MFEVEVPRKQNEYPYTREERLARRFKGTVLCSWCNKRTQIPAPTIEKKNKHSWGDYDVEKWIEYRDHIKEFYCKRPNCVAAVKELNLRPKKGRLPNYFTEE